MSMNDINKEVKPIDFSKLLKVLLKNKKLYAKILPVVFVVTYLLILCIPRYYRCSVELAPEISGPSSSGSLSSIASSFGLGSLAKMAGNDDAINVELYPDLLSSPNFIVTLFPVKVTTKDGSLSTDYFTYFKDHRSVAVWDKYIFIPIHNMLSPSVPSNIGKDMKKINLRTLSKSDQDVVDAIASNIKCSIDKKTDAITITVEDQDPEVCATLADSVVAKMQDFIVEYRTKKARNDYAYYKKLCDEAKAVYEHSRQLFASYSDANTDATLKGISSKIDDLENDMQLKYNAYSALATQAQMAQAKIQENTPAFTAIKTAIRPEKPAGPKRTLIALGVTIFSFCVISVRLIMKNE